MQVLPDPLSVCQFWEFADGHGIARDEAVSRTGGSR
jgi:hypothetical protein